jgi:hypothetical protein
MTIPSYIKVIPRPHITIGTKPLEIIERAIKEINVMLITWIILAGIEFNEISIVIVKR